MMIRTALFGLLICTALFQVHSSEADPEEEVRGDEQFGFTDDEYEQVKSSEESYEFEAEVGRLMDIIINALYSNRDIFLRELISNSADALDKIRFLSLSDESILGEGEQRELDIRVSMDKEAKAITITDRGVGMTRDDLIKNLGVVAKSGTTDFIEAATKDTSDPLSLIGQFGVGFYSVYLVADKVTVASKHNDDDQYIWESYADKTFTVAKDPRGNTLLRGTSVTIHLKEDAEEYLTESKLEKIVSRYSQFVNFPIYLSKKKTIEEEVDLTEEEIAELRAELEAEKAAEEEDAELDLDDVEATEDDDLEVSDEEDEDEEEIPTTKTVKKKVQEWVRINDVKAIWARPAAEVTDEEYTEFYESLTGDKREPLDHIHFSAEGEISFRSILFVPKRAPADLYNMKGEKSTALRLFVRRVLISDEFDDFLPDYLKFIQGVVDSDDLPLNVSRETLAQSRVLRVMSKKITRKALEMLRKMAQREEDYQESLLDDDDEDEEADVDAGETEDEDGDDDEEEEEEEEPYTKYTDFWTEFGRSIKLGVMNDTPNKSKLVKLLRYTTSESPDSIISFSDYVDGMKDDQQFIYYISGDSQEEVSKSPFLEKATSLGYEVIFMCEPLDEYIMDRVTEFDGFKLQSVTKQGLTFGEGEDDSDQYEEHYEDFTEWYGNVLGDKVKEVVVSPRLSSSPAIVVTPKYGSSAYMEKLMRGQTLRADMPSNMYAKKVLEINPRHAVIVELAERAEKDGDNQETKDLAELVFNAALVQSGFVVDGPNEFAARIHRVVANGLGTEPTELVVDDDAYFEETEEDEEDEEEVEEL